MELHFNDWFFFFEIVFNKWELIKERNYPDFITVNKIEEMLKLAFIDS